MKKPAEKRGGPPRDLGEVLASVIELYPQNAEPAEDAGPSDEVLAERRRARAVRRLPMPLPPEARTSLAKRAWSDRPALRVARAWLDAIGSANARRVLVMLGRPGTGKTYASAVVALKVGGRCEYVKLRDLCRLYRAGWGEEREQYEALIKAPLLVLDELGTERGPDIEVAVAALHDVIDERQRPGLLTMVLGNISRAQFLDGRYDERTIDRLRSCGAVREVGGESMRRGSL